MVVPLWVGEDLWGVINVEEVTAAAFGDDDLLLLQTVAAQVGSAMRSALLYERLERAYLGTAEALAAALEAKDAYTADHARSIVEQAEAVGLRLGLDDEDLRDLRFAAVFHDIGKISVPEAILHKDGPLDREERAIMERHTVVGEQILQPVEFLAGVRKLVRHEHERWDGRGYPDGLSGLEIPLGVAHHPRLRRAARDDVGPAVPQGDVVRARDRGAAPQRRHAVRPGGRRRPDRGARRSSLRRGPEGWQSGRMHRS